MNERLRRQFNVKVEIEYGKHVFFSIFKGVTIDDSELIEVFSDKVKITLKEGQIYICEILELNKNSMMVLDKYSEREIIIDYKDINKVEVLHKRTDEEVFDNCNYLFNILN